MSKTYINVKTGGRVDVSDQPTGEWTDAELRKRGYVTAAEFDAIDKDGDGEVSKAEAAATKKAEAEKAKAEAAAKKGGAK